MPPITLHTAIGTYGHTRPLKDGSVTSDKLTFDHVEISLTPVIFRRMVRTLEFDVSEMALATYFCARAHGKAFTGLPIFVTRSFYHDTMTYNVKSGIQSPRDLEGRKVGVRSYTFTPGVWTRGLLQSAYGVDLDAVTWVISGAEHVAEYVAPSNVVYSESSDLTEMLKSGEIDAAIGVPSSESPDFKPLFENADQDDENWYKQTQIYPISHILVVKDQQLADNPWLAEELQTLFEDAKKPYMEHLHGGEYDAMDKSVLRMAEITGGDPLTYDFQATHKTLETFIEFNAQQKVIPQKLTPEELFPTAS